MKGQWIYTTINCKRNPPRNPDLSWYIVSLKAITHLFRQKRRRHPVYQFRSNNTGILEPLAMESARVDQAWSAKPPSRPVPATKPQWFEGPNMNNKTTSTLPVHVLIFGPGMARDFIWYDSASHSQVSGPLWVLAHNTTACCLNGLWRCPAAPGSSMINSGEVLEPLILMGEIST